MKIRILEEASQLKGCPEFYVDHLLWGTADMPLTKGQIGFLPGTGFLVKMTCMESSPKRDYTENNSPVCRDSAMEVFLMPDPQETKKRIYLNLEMNANGVILGEYGVGRSGRTFLTEEQIKSCGCSAHIDPDSWSVQVTIPLSLLNDIYQEVEFIDASSVYLNFYKISEDPEIEHYASYSPVLSEEPNFHLPEYFEKCELYNE